MKSSRGIPTKGIESVQCSNYIRRSCNEITFENSAISRGGDVGVIVTQGFEERSLGILEAFKNNGVSLSQVIINRYSSTLPEDKNERFGDRMEIAAQRVAAGRYAIVQNTSNSSWLLEALERIPSNNVVVDITALSNTGMFAALDALALCKRRIWIAYSEPEQYWPMERDWDQLNKELSTHDNLADVMDSKPWISGYSHHVQILAGHEGYDSVGRGRALIGFLPFKCARIKSIMGEADYEECLFLAGRPRLTENRWRLRALKKINESVIKEWRVVTLSTFGYRKTVKELSSLLLGEGSLLQQYNVHLAILGSKLQTVGCWILSSIIPSITMVTSVPSRYYPEAFSAGIGAKWVFPLTPPFK